MIEVDAMSPAEAETLAAAHLTLHGHQPTRVDCDCGQTLGWMCETCREPIAYCATGPHQ